MKFLRYCCGIDFDISDEACRPFGDGKIFGYKIGNNVYLGVSGNPNLFCHFNNDDDTELTEDFLCHWGENISSFIKDTIGTVVNLRLAVEVPSILRNLKCYENGVDYNLTVKPPIVYETGTTEELRQHMLLFHSRFYSVFISPFHNLNKILLVSVNKEYYKQS